MYGHHEIERHVHVSIFADGQQVGAVVGIWQIGQHTGASHHGHTFMLVHVHVGVGSDLPVFAVAGFPETQIGQRKYFLRMNRRGNKQQQPKRHFSNAVN